MNDVAKLALFVTCVAGYALPALALRGPVQPPAAHAAHTDAPVAGLDCRGVRAFARDDAANARDAADTRDSGADCDVNATVSLKR